MVAVAAIIFLFNDDKLFPLFWLILLIIPVLGILAVYITYLLSKKWPVFFQIGRFAAVGSSNFAVDIGILNLLQFFTGAGFSGIIYAVFKTISFVVAVINSFIWNKFWTFKETDTKKITGEFIIFFIVTAFNTAVDVIVATSVITFIAPPFDLSQKAWGTIGGAASGAFVAMFLNFLSYKFIVFKKKDDGTLSQISAPKI